jgi:hypothetical protein
MVIKKLLYAALLSYIFSFSLNSAQIVKYGTQNYSESLYAQVLNLSMQTWSDCRILCENNDAAEELFFDCHDLIVGRLLRLQHYVHRLCQTSLEDILVVDISYVVNILNSMEEEQHYLNEKNSLFKDSLVLELLKNVKQQLNALL